VCRVLLCEAVEDVPETDSSNGKGAVPMVCQLPPTTRLGPSVSLLGGYRGEVVKMSTSMCCSPSVRRQETSSCWGEVVKMSTSMCCSPSVRRQETSSCCRG